MTCPGSNITLDGPDGTTTLTCPNCGRRVKAVVYDVFKFVGQPRFTLRGHQV